MLIPRFFQDNFASFCSFLMFLDALEPPVVSALNAFGIIKKYLKLEKCEHFFTIGAFSYNDFQKILAARVHGLGRAQLIPVSVSLVVSAAQIWKLE